MVLRRNIRIRVKHGVTPNKGCIGVTALPTITK